MSHYYPIHHSVLDKYERSSFHRIIKQDIENWIPTKKYELIISISTIEHIGWDEVPRKPEKALIAIENIKKMLLPDGKAVLSIPVGYNEFLDKKIHEGKIECRQTLCLKRDTTDNQWMHVEI
jgi:hypothetical protein